MMLRTWVLLSSLCAVGLSAPSARAGDKARARADAFWGNEVIHTVHLRVSAHAWELMQPNRRARPSAILDSAPLAATRPVGRARQAAGPNEDLAKRGGAVEGDALPPCIYGFEYAYVKAAFECDGEALADVGLRFKGNSSYENYRSGLRRPLKVDFDRFVPGRKFRGGIETLNFSNNAFDTSSLREALAYDAYRQAGVPAPRTAFANVYLTVDGLHDHELVGLYTIVEEMDDKAFLKAHFGGRADGLMLKPESVRGLPYLGEDWAPYAERYRPKTHPADPASARRLIEFTKLINYADDATFRAKVGEYLAVDAFVRYAAVTVMIASLDSPLVNNHNYYLYIDPADGRAWMLPWDMNLSFASYGIDAQGDNQVNLTITRPWGEQNRLFHRVMSIEANEAAYKRYLREFAETFFAEGATLGRIARMQCTLVAADEAAAAVGRPTVSTDIGGRFASRSRYPIEEYVPLRVASVLAQLDGRDVPVFTPRAGMPGMAFRWGLNAGAEFGMLSTMAQAVRKAGDADGDFGLSPREARDAAAALYYACADERDPSAGVTAAQLAVGLTPLLQPFAPQDGRRGGGFFGRAGGGGGAYASPTAGLWARAIVREADEDGDAKVTLAEITSLATRLACLADRDRSERLDEREIAEGLDLLAAPPGGADKPVVAPAAGRGRTRR